MKAGKNTEQERSHWDAACIPVSHSAESTQTTQTITGDRK